MCVPKTKGRQKLATKVEVEGSGTGRGKAFGQMNSVCKDTEAEGKLVYWNVVRGTGWLGSAGRYQTRQETRQGSRSSRHLKPHLGALFYPHRNELSFFQDYCDGKEEEG